MQKGFATLEVILAVLIVSLLASAAIPNAIRTLDRVTLDCETKKIYTDLRFLQSFGRMTNMKDTHFSTTDDNPINLIVYPERYVFKKVSDNKIYAEHYFSNYVTASKKSGTGIWQIKFDDMGKVTPAESANLKLNSRFGKSSIIFDSVGRFRGGRE